MNLLTKIVETSRWIEPIFLAQAKFELSGSSPNGPKPVKNALKPELLSDKNNKA